MIFSFRPGPVTVITTVTYLALLIALVTVHLTVPHQPDLGRVGAADTTDLAEAWLDLANLTRHYHPFNSWANDETRTWLLSRVRHILDSNHAEYRVDYSGGVGPPDLFSSSSYSASDDPTAVGPATEQPDRADLLRARGGARAPVVIFDDIISNVTAVQKTASYNRIGRHGDSGGTYFEGDNIAVYIPGTEDPAGDWWTHPAKSYGKGGVLLNAHFDSVSTGYGATDDGMGVISLLQALKHFTHPDVARLPKGIIILFNNNEEDSLWGARAFGYSPLLPLVTTFVNLEGAGAGGRAVLFRTTDRQVTQAYAASPFPFGTVIGSDLFKAGFIRSDTDYSVWDRVYGQRGADIAFYSPRSLYHTSEDDTRHTTRDSLAHMLSAAIATTAAMAADTTDRFLGPRPDRNRDKAQNGRGTDGVWFDLFGRAFVVFELRSALFAWSLALLIAGPIILATLTFMLAQKDRYYFFARDVALHEDAADQPVSLAGWKGFMRFPLGLIVAGGLVVGSGYLVGEVNPMIVYSSEYAVWAMMLSLSYLAFWASARIANRVRPSALHRGYAHLWLYALTWIALVVATVFEDRFAIASGYLVVFLQAAALLSTLITICDFFALPAKREFAADAHDTHRYLNQIDGSNSQSEQALLAPTADEISPSSTRGRDDHPSDGSDSDPDENTPLRHGEDGGTGGGAGLGGAGAAFGATTFRTTIVDASRRSISALLKRRDRHRPFGREQTWSSALPSATWLPQWLLLGPVVIVLFGQVGLYTVTAACETGADGSSLMVPYLLVALTSILVILPLTPFAHRITHHVPALLFVVFAATLAYNLTAFPFSPARPYKVYFQQVVDLAGGTNQVTLTGHEEYVRAVMAEIPTASGQPGNITCSPHAGRGLMTCGYDGATVPPNVGAAPFTDLDKLVSFNTSQPDGAVNQATLHIDADNTKDCIITFDRPIATFHVRGSSGRDHRFYSPPDEGIDFVRLYRRRRSPGWDVDLRWTDGASHTPGGGRPVALQGSVACSWDDANVPGTIPALDEVQHYMPEWSIVTKLTVGLVEIRKRFEVGGSR